MLKVCQRLLVALCAILAIPVLGAGTAHAEATLAITAPVADQVWWSGQTRTITWTVGAETGAYHLELWGASTRLGTIGSGSDITTGSYTWTLPRTVTGWVGEHVHVKLVPTVGTAVDSASFAVRTSALTGASSCRDAFQRDVQPVFCLNGDNPSTWFPAGQSQIVMWGRDGDIGGPVKIELLRTVSGKTTATVLVKSTPDDGQEVVVIPAKTALDTTGAQTYQWRITDLTAGSSTTSRFFSVTGSGMNALLHRPHDGSLAVGEWIDLQVDPGRSFSFLNPDTLKVELVPTKGSSITVYSGPLVVHSLGFRATVPGTFQVLVTDVTTKQKVTATEMGPFDNTAASVTVVASTEVVRQEALSDATATIGQPITITWNSYDSPSDTDPNGTVLPVDINLVSAAGKVTKLYQAYTGVWVTSDHRPDPQLVEGKVVWRPASTIAPGAYTIKVSRTGTTTTSDQAITIAAPTSLSTVSLPGTSAQPGEPVPLSWKVSDDAELPVDVSLVAGGTSRSIAKKLTAAGNSTTVTIPPGTPAGAYRLTVTTVDKFGSAKAALSADTALTVTAPTLSVTATTDVALEGKLTVAWTFSGATQVPVKLELVAAGSTTAAATIAASAATGLGGSGSFTWTVPVGLKPGAGYVVRATPIGLATTITASSKAVAVTAPTMAVTLPSLPGGVRFDQAIALTWTATGGIGQSVTVSLVKDGKVVSTLDTAAATVGGSGSLRWIVSWKLAPGTGYTIRVTDNAAKTITADSAIFNVRPNDMKLG